MSLFYELGPLAGNEELGKASRDHVPYVLSRFPQTDEELWWFVYATFGVRIPRRSVCPGHTSPFRAFADAYFARAPVCVWKASRGFGGKTFLLSLLGSVEMASLGVFVTILGGSGAQSARVHESMQLMWESPGAPDYMIEKMTQYQTVLTNRARAITLTASTKSVRGPHPQRMRLDEVDEMDLEILTSAQGQPMRSARLPHIDTNTVMSSTHQYPDGTMTYILNEAKDRNWPVYHWCYKETSNPIDGWLSPEEIERKKSEIPRAMWEAEYELQEPSFDGRAIDTDAVNRYFDVEIGEVSGKPSRYYQFQFPRPDREYVTAVDWAKEKDWTVVLTYDITDDPWRLVAFQRMQRLPWPQMIDKVNMRIARFPGRFIHDSTGIGNVVKDYLKIPNSMNRRNVVDQTLGGSVRSAILEEYISAIEQGKLKAPRIAWMTEEHRLATRDDIFGRGHLPDSICAGALAWSMRTKRNVRPVAPIIMGDGLYRKTSPWKIA